jgi:hypothetical protein
VTPAEIAALVTGGSAALLGLWNALRVRRLERFRSRLVREEAATKAKLDYEYHARRRMYEHFEPALFRLLVRADFALERIRSLTDPSVWRQFTPAEEEPPRDARRPTLAANNYVVVSTLYGLFAPLVLIRAMGRDLTLVDLSLEPRIELQYHLASRIYGSFKDDAELAALSPPLPYDPHHAEWRTLRRENPAVYWWQGLTMGRLERVLDVLTVAAETGGAQRLASFGEFESRYGYVVAHGDESEKKTLAVASNALLEFRPDLRPVLWRMLIAQARLYQALLRTRLDGFRVPTTDGDWQSLLVLGQPEGFGWKVQVAGAPALAETVAVTDAYLRRVVVDARTTQHSPPRKRRWH